jgi:hypothetical protein
MANAALGVRIARISPWSAGREYSATYLVISELRLTQGLTATAEAQDVVPWGISWATAANPVRIWNAIFSGLPLRRSINQNHAFD